MNLQQKANTFGLQGETFANVNEALKAAMVKASKEDLIVVCGSVFLVGEVEMKNKFYVVSFSFPIFKRA